MAQQTCLEKKGIETRQETIIRNDYNKSDEYNDQHKDALSTGDPLGKGSGNGAHGHSVPDCSKPKGMIDYSNFDTHSQNIGGQYDIEGRNGQGGRNYLMTISLYNENNQYGINSVDTSANVADGQVVIW